MKCTWFELSLGSPVLIEVHQCPEVVASGVEFYFIFNFILGDYHINL